MSDKTQRIHFYSNPEDKNALSRLGVSHGFTGIGGTHPPFEIHSPQQVHGIALVQAGSGTVHGLSEEQRAKADAIWTSEANVTIGIKTADCLPLLFCGKDLDLTVAVHAGWRGLCQGIVLKAYEAFAQKSEPVVVLGPCISQEAFEIGPELLPAFQSLGLSSAQMRRILLRGKGDRWHADLALAACFLLLNRGLEPENISVMRSCTKKMDRLWYSYRRDGADDSRNWSWVSL